MNWKEPLNKFIWPLIGAAIGIMIGGWITNGSPFKADWVGGALMVGAYMVGRGIRLLADRTDRIERERATK
jgi:putative Mn2+ efflux pump MntP